MALAEPLLAFAVWRDCWRCGYRSRWWHLLLALLLVEPLLTCAVWRFCWRCCYRSRCWRLRLALLLAERLAELVAEPLLR